MKLDFDTVRDVLLKIESIDSLTDYYEFSSDTSDNNTIYAIQKLTEAGYLDSIIDFDMSGNVYGYVKSLTWQGHQFLDNIKSPKAVKYAKSVINELGSFSIPIIADVAASFAKKLAGL